MSVLNFLSRKSEKLLFLARAVSLIAELGNSNSCVFGNYVMPGSRHYQLHLAFSVKPGEPRYSSFTLPFRVATKAFHGVALFLSGRKRIVVCIVKGNAGSSFVYLSLASHG